MKKILKVKIARNQSGGKTSYTYPSEYMAIVEKIQVIAYETTLTDKYDHVVNRGNDHEYVLVHVDESYVANLVKNPDIKLVDRIEAEAFIGNDLHKYDTKTTDQQVINTILAKVVSGETITQADKDALDPNHPAKGLGRSRTLKEALDEILGG